MNKEIQDIFAGLSYRDVTQQVQSGELLAALQKPSQGLEQRSVLQDVRMNGKGQFRIDSTFLSLLLTFQASSQLDPIEKELVLQLPLKPSQQVQCWFYPEDPDLPALAELDDASLFLRKTSWEIPFTPIFPSGARISIKRLRYNARSRVTCLLRESGTSRGLILKVMGKDDFDVALKSVMAVSDSMRPQRFSIPRCISYSWDDKAFLYEYLPGKKLSKLGMSSLKERQAPLFEAVVHILTEIHQTQIDLPQWTPKLDAETMQRYLNHIEMGGLKAARFARRLFEKFLNRMSQATGSYTQLIHNDFTEKNILYEDKGSRLFKSENLSIIDWDGAAIGPIEKDLALFLSKLFPEKADRLSFLDLYQSKTGASIDFDLLNAFLLFRPFIRRCQKMLSPLEGKASHIESLQEIDTQLENHPFRRAC